MALLALHSASTALSSLNTELDVIANNLANVNTDGFKRSRVNFEDLLYEEKAQPGTENAIGDQRPMGIYVGLGTNVAGTHLDFRQGAQRLTERELDVTIAGNGFFQVQVEDDLGEGLAYTRSGNFALNRDSEVVLANSQGRRLDPPLQLPEFATSVSISEDGRVFATVAGSNDLQEVGQIDIAIFVNPAGLRQVGGNLYVPSVASGEAQIGQPAEGGRGRLMQGALEASNVDPVTELVSLIKTQRAFELNSQSIQAADEVLQTVGRLRSF